MQEAQGARQRRPAVAFRRVVEGARSCAVLRPAVAEAARRTGAAGVGLVEVGAGGAALLVDRVGVDLGDGRRLGDASSPVQLVATVRGVRPVPALPPPPVVARTGVARRPVDLADPDAARTLRAGAGASLEDLALFDAVVALAALTPVRWLAGDPVERLWDAVDAVPARALPVLLTTWALSGLPPERRDRVLQRLHEAAAGRPVAWVSVEGVGVAPGVPTLGDRPASGHSTVGMTLLDRGAAQVEVVARCWGRGRWLEWLPG